MGEFRDSRLGAPIYLMCLDADSLIALQRRGE
jgi:hypothetical protein